MGNKIEGNSSKENQEDGKTSTDINEENIKNQRLAYLDKLLQENSNKMEIDDITENDNMLFDGKEDKNKEKNKSNVTSIIKENNVSSSLINKNIITSTISNNTTNSNDTNATNVKPPPKNIDLEHVTIEKIFKITLDKDKSDKFRYLESYSEGLKESSKEMKFRVSDIDNLIILLIELEGNNVLDYFLKSFHRAYEIVEVRFKQVLQEKFSDFLRMLISYFSMIITSPENFDLNFDYKAVETIFEAYMKSTYETNEEELYCFLNICVSANEDNEESMKAVFNYIFNIINAQIVKGYITDKGSFFKCEDVKKNINLLKNFLNKNTKNYKAYVSHKDFIPKQLNNQSIVRATPLGIFLSLNALDTDPEEQKRYLSAMSMKEAQVQISNVSEKTNTYIKNLSDLILPLLNSNEGTQYFINLANLNTQKLKMYSPPHMNTDGTLLNAFYTMLNCFLNISDSENALERVIFIDSSFFKISELDKFEKINHDEKTNENLLKTNNNYESFLPETKAFVFSHLFLSEILEGLNKRNRALIQQAQTLSMTPTNPEFKKVVTQLNSIYSYFKCPKFTKKLIQFLEITAFFCFTRNNSKYNISNFVNKGKDFFTDFLSDFSFYIEDEESPEFNAIPEIVISNVAKSIKFLKETNNELFNKHIDSCKTLVYFSLIYSSKVNIIKNPYIRAEALDIVEYFFIDQNKKEAQSNKLIRIFNDDLIKKIFIYSLVRVFIDSERLGGSNQFYEKFGVRYKILLLIDSVKSQISIDDQLIFYAKNYKDDCILLVNYLINDLTFMGDETIERLKSIKLYEDLKLDNDAYSLLSEEEKKNKEEKFTEDSSRCKNCVPFFKSYLQFLVTINNTCQSLILEYKLGQKLANLLNYLLNMFASRSGNALKVSNFSQYKFNPQEFLSLIIQAFCAFVEYKDFWTYIISDERSFHFDNFKRALNLRSKIRMNYNDGENFLKLVNGINSIKENVSANIIDYDDAPEEYLDPITADLMEDPVMLPYSKQIVDRLTIEQHILSDPKDPFSRTPLTKSELIECPDLKEKIKKYREEKMMEIKNKNK